MRVEKLVVKVGTNLLVGENGKLDKGFIISLASVISRIMKSGIKVSLVSSGARAAGYGLLRISGISLREKQALCAVGQVELMKIYESAFDFHGVKVAQLLLTRDDFHNRRRFLNLRNTLITLMELGVLPIINENDTVVTEEIEFGDNDILASMYSVGWGADHLILLTTVDGIMDSNGKLIEKYSDDVEIPELGTSRWGSGGMSSKIEAAKMAFNAGIRVCICSGRDLNNVLRFIDGERVGTVFEPIEVKRRKARKMWIGFLAKPRGSIRINNGAVDALKNGKSLLAVGIIGVEGKFQKGDVVKIVDENGRNVGRGITNYSSDEVDEMKGLHHVDEVIHADNLVLT